MSKIANTTIQIYTDASFRDGRCGYSFVYRQYKRIAPTVVYGSCNCYSSTAAELTAIIRSLQYMKMLGLTTHPLIVYCDVESIVQSMKKKHYIKWEKASWKKSSGNPITANVLEWIELSNLKKDFSSAPFGFKKVMRDNLHYAAHQYGRVGLNHASTEDNFLFTAKLVKTMCGTAYTEDIKRFSLQELI